jgi:hypothetical protein
VPTLAGEAAVRIVPSMRGFHKKLDRELKTQQHSVDVVVNANTRRASAEMTAWRQMQERNHVSVPIRADFASFQRDLSQVEHIFKRHAVNRAVRLNIQVVGLNALPALAYAAGAAASGLDALGKSAFALPGLVSAAGASVGALAVGLHGVKDAFSSMGDAAADAAERSQKLRDADRDLVRSKRDLVSAVRDQRRELEDLNAEMRRSSLNEADAILSVQEDANRLREGGFKSITELQRAQLNYLKSVDNLQSVRTRNTRLQQDVTDANEKGVIGSDKVADALDRVADAADKVTKATSDSSLTDFQKAMGKLAPSAQSFVTAVQGMKGAWGDLQNTVQGSLFDGLDRAIVDLGQKALPGLEIGLSRVASGLNANFKSVAESLGNDTNGSFMERIFGNTDAGLTNLSRAMNPLIEGFLRMSQVGSEFLPRLGDAAERVFTRFDEFTKRVAADGSLARWIDQGMDALTGLGNSLINIGSIIGSVANAFNQAQGNGGFFGWLERGTKNLSDYLKSAVGQQGLVGYFSKARELMDALSDSFNSIMPLVTDLTDIAREWSVFMLRVVGAMANTASWIEKHTGLLKPLLFAYLSFRTLSPMWEAVTSGAKNYRRVIEGLGRWQATSDIFARSNQGLQTLQSNFKAIGGVAPLASSALRSNSTALSNVNQQTRALFQPNQALITSMNNIKQSVNNASQAVGTGGGRGLAAGGRSLLGALGGLAAFIGPAIGAGILGIALAAAFAGLNKMGEAHRNAAADADRQRQALDGLKGSIDRVTGAASAAAISQVAQTSQNYNIPGFGGRNLLQDSARAGVNPQQFLRGTNPINQQDRTSILDKLDRDKAAQIEASPEWQRYKDKFLAGGVDALTLAKAANGDPASIQRVEAVEREVFGKPRSEMNAVERTLMSGDQRLPSLTEFAQVGSWDTSTTAIGLRDISSTLSSGGAAAQAANQAQFGVRRLNAAGAAKFAQFGAIDDGKHVFVDTNGNAVILTDRDPGIDPEIGTTQQNSAGQFQTALTAEATKQLLEAAPGFASGGMIGGVGTGTSDSNLMLASRGEFVTKKKAVDHYGPDFFQRLNNMQLPKFDGGGLIGGGGQGIVSPKPKVPIPAGGTPFDILLNAPKPAGPTSSIFGAGGQGVNTAGSYTAPPVTSSLGSALSGNAGSSGRFPISGAQVYDPIRNSPLASVFDPSPVLNAAAAANAPKAPSAPVKPAGGSVRPSAGSGGSAGKPAASTGVPHAGSGAYPGPHGGGANPGPGNTGVRSAAVGAARAAALPQAQLLGGPTAVAAQQIAGMPLLARVPNSEAGLQLNTLAVKRIVENMFPQITDIGGVRADPLPWHPNGLAVDVMIPNWDTPEGKALGDQIYGYLNAHAQELGIDYMMWQEADHYDHIHVNTTGGGMPTGGEQFGLTPSMLAASGLQLDANGLPAGTPGTDLPWINQVAAALGINLPGSPSSSSSGSTSKNPYDPKNITTFLGGQAQNVGSQLLQIGTQFLSGITGIDFGSILGTGQSIANGILDLSGGQDGGQGAGGTELNDLATDEMQQYMNGGNPLSVTGGLDGLLGAAGSVGLGGGNLSYNPGGGAEQWRPLVRQMVAALAAQYGITNVQAWEDALVKQIQSESSGNPNSVNPNDSSGQGGTQRVAGLLNFLDTTFAAHNILGGDYMDPAAQIAAAIDYVYTKYGMNDDGSPKQIGQGVGFKRGGVLKGKGGPKGDSNLVRVSRGEFLHNAAAVRHYGPDFLSRLNNMQVPRESLPGFADGMWWNPLAAGPAAAPQAAGPLPTNTPAPAPPPPASVGAQAPGPLPLTPPAAPGGIAGGPPAPAAVDGISQTAATTPSTGGAPGPGATAPVSDPGALPGVSDALAGVGGAISGGASGAQPGAAAGEQTDPRATLGAAPQSQEHNLPALSSGIQGAFSTAGSIAAMAIQAGAAGATMGGSAAMGGMGAGQAGQAAQAGAQIAGQVASSAVNILSSLGVGTLTGGSTAQASGIPLLPQRQPVQTGVPAQGQGPYQDNRTYHLTNLDQYRALQEREAAQKQDPYLARF